MIEAAKRHSLFLFDRMTVQKVACFFVSAVLEAETAWKRTEGNRRRDELDVDAELEVDRSDRFEGGRACGR